MRLDKNRILKLSEDIRNGNGLIEELIEALGGKRLYDVFDEQTIDSLVSNVVNNGKFHTLIDDGNGFDILEGLLNDKVKGNLTDFYMIKPDYILALSKKQQKNMAESISGGDKELANSLQNLWEKGIKTEACSTKRSDDKPMFQLSIDADARVNDGDILHVGNLEFRVIHTPGHTRGGSSLYCESENMVFAGDTLFKGMWGRTDLPTSNFNEIINSINNKLLVLPGDTIVYPGHGISTQIQEEEPIDENLLLED